MQFLSAWSHLWLIFCIIWHSSTTWVKHISFSPLDLFGTLLGNVATHRRHRVLVDAVLHIPVSYPFIIIFTSAERRRLFSKGKGYVFIHICWFVCLLAISQENKWTDFMKVAGYVRLGARNNLELFGDVRLNPLHTWFLFLFFFWGIHVC